MPERTRPRAPATCPTVAPRPPGSAHILLFFALGAVVFWLTRHANLWDGWLEDLPVYSHALNAWRTGRNPYDASFAPLFFLYPPIFLYLAGFVTKVLPLHWSGVVYVVVHLTSIICLPLVLARFFFRQTWLSPLFALLLFFASPRFTGVLALLGLNVASTLYCIAFVAAVPGLRRNRWEWFYLAVFIAAIIKITFLALLLLPLLAGRRQWLRSIACIAVVIGMNIGEFALVPSLYRGYLWSLQQGILTNKAFGYGVFGILASYHHRERGVGFAAYAVSGLLAVLLVGLMLRLRWRLERAGGVAQNLASNSAWLALVVITLVLVNPREMQYDMDIALFVGFVLWVHGLKTQRLLALMTLLFVPSLVVPFIVLNPHLHGMYETLLTLAAFGLGYWRILRDVKATEHGHPFLIA